jgi:hypothetical protein
MEGRQARLGGGDSGEGNGRRAGIAPTRYRAKQYLTVSLQRDRFAAQAAGQAGRTGPSRPRGKRGTGCVVIAVRA